MIYQATPTFNLSRTAIVTPERYPEQSFALWLQTLINQAVRAIPTTSTFAEIPVRTNYYGEFAWITDSDTDTPGTVIAGGGAFDVLGMWDGTNWIVIGGAGVGGPAPPDTSVQYNDNGQFGGSKLFYDKTLEAFGLLTPAIADTVVYGLLESTVSTDQIGLEFDVGTIAGGTGSTIGLIGYGYNDGGTLAAGKGPFGVFGYAQNSAGSADVVIAVYGNAIVDGGTVAQTVAAVGLKAQMSAGTVNDLIGCDCGVDFSGGTVSVTKCFSIREPITGAVPTEAYGLSVGDQTVPGMADPDKNWAVFINGSANNFGVKATGLPCANGLDGVSGTFTTVDLKTVTVTNGLITAIV